MLIRGRGRMENKIGSWLIIVLCISFHIKCTVIDIALQFFFFIFIQKDDSMISAATIFLSFVNHLCTKSANQLSLHVFHRYNI